MRSLDWQAPESQYMLWDTAESLVPYNTLWTSEISPHFFASLYISLWNSYRPIVHLRITSWAFNLLMELM